MDIKNLLNKEIEAAKETKDEKDKTDAVLEQEAAQLFQPIVLAMEQLNSELSQYSEINFSISQHFVTVRLGENTKLETHRYGWSHNFSVEEANTYQYPEYEVFEHTHEFSDAPSVIGFIVKKCAEYVANRRK